MECEDKIKTKEELMRLVEDLKNQGKKIVHCHGVFDLIHPGHIRHFKFAKEQGDILLVSITGDNFVDKEYLNPFATSSLRARSLASVEYIDLVFVNENPYAKDLLQEIKPNVYIKGGEYANDAEKRRHPGFLEEKRIIEESGGKVVYSPGDVIFSSSQIMTRLLKRDDLKEERINNFLKRYNVSKDNLIGVISRFKDSKILVLGDFFVEDYIFCKSKASPDSPTLKLEFLDSKRFLGGVGSVVQYLHNLGAEIKAVSIGNNDSKEALEKINPSLENKIEFVDVEGYELAIKTKFLSDEQKIFELNRKGKIKFDEKVESDFINKVLDILDNFDGIIFCDYSKGFLTENIINSIIRVAKDKNIFSTIISEDEKTRDIIKYRDMDFVVFSEEEIREIINNFSEGIDSVSRKVLSQTRYKNLIINLGREGIIGYDPLKDYQTQSYSSFVSYLPSFSDVVIDSNGEKESLISAITLSLVSKGDVYSSMYLGNCVSSIASTKKGNQPVYLEELDSLIANKEFLENHSL